MHRLTQWGQWMKQIRTQTRTLIKRRISVLAAVFSVVACMASTPVARADQKPLVVGVDTAFMPFEFMQDGVYVGFDIDLWKAIAAKNGWQYRIQPMDFTGLIPALQTRQLDAALAGIAINDKRRQAVDFSAPYYNSGLSALVRSNVADVPSVMDLNGKHIAAKTGTATIDWIKQHLPKSKITQFPNVDQAYMALDAGRVDAAMHDTPNVEYYAHTSGKGRVKVVGEPVAGDQYGIAFPKNSPLVAQVDTALHAIQADGEYAQIYRKWFGKDPAPQKAVE